VIPLVAPVESNGPQRHLRVTPFNCLGGMPTGDRTQMRRALRAIRANLSPLQRATAARMIASHIATGRWLQGARPIGLYTAVGYEVATAPLSALARQRHCPVYLPRITDYRQHRMTFVLESSLSSVRDRHGIPQPAGHSSISARALSVVFLPVLGFDAHGTRLGSGAGYYDRLFAFRRHRHSWHRPLLVGIAYRCQQLPHIDHHEHDVPLDALVSEDGVTYFN
jgi:5-formyltetrahydrofolate cyclo-ligase